MKLYVISDVHLEHAPFDPLSGGYDAVVLAGDIGVGTKGLDWIQQQFDKDVPIIYVAGNHEFYGLEYGDTLTQIRELASRSDNIYFLDRQSAVINGVRFLGTTLWTDFNMSGNAANAMIAARSYMNDFRIIRDRNSLNGIFSPVQAKAIHFENVKWLSNQLQKPHDGKTVVVTHHAPSGHSIHPKYDKNILNGSFASDLTDLIGQVGPQLWVHGHTHDPFDYTIHNTRIVCNPRGYPTESNGFNKSLIVEI